MTPPGSLFTSLPGAVGHDTSEDSISENLSFRFDEVNA
jgi:hypothetical protein